MVETSEGMVETSDNMDSSRDKACLVSTTQTATAQIQNCALICQK